MSNITPFAYEGGEVRFYAAGDSIEIVASDLAKQLGYRMASDMTRHLDEDEKGTRLVRTPGGEQEIATVTEAGMYRAIVTRQTGRMADPARRETIRAFQRWVTHEVLPAIRQRGGYLTPEAAEEALTDPDFIIRLATDLKRARAEREAMAAYARELEPKAANYDRFLSGDGTYSIGAVAKILGRSQNKLFAELRNAGVLIAKGAMRNTPYQKYMHHFTVRAYDYTRSDGTAGTSYTTKVQPSGLAFIQAKLGIIAGVTA